MDDYWIAAEREWREPSNWRCGWLGLYVAPRDPRILVRKRAPRFGWTFNYAHLASWCWTVALIAIPVVVLAISRWLEQ